MSLGRAGSLRESPEGSPLASMPPLWSGLSTIVQHPLWLIARETTHADCRQTPHPHTHSTYTLITAHARTSKIKITLHGGRRKDDGDRRGTGSQLSWTWWGRAAEIAQHFGMGSGQLNLCKTEAGQECMCLRSHDRSGRQRALRQHKAGERKAPQRSPPGHQKPATAPAPTRASSSLLASVRVVQQ